MYSNIPVKDAIKTMKQTLTDSDINKEEIEEITNIVKIITNQNYFQHDNKIYQQTDGLAMGNPLSGTLADIYINYNERAYILNEKNKYRDKIIFWHRYVDDIIILFNGTNRQLTQLHNYINSINPQLQFTIETECNKTINFLDLSITHINKNFEFSIHRKPTHTDHTIHKNSNHPINQKLAAYTHMIHRLNNIPMSTVKYDEELDIIKYIATNNGFNPTTIQNMNNKYKRRLERLYLTTLTTNKKDPGKYIPINYSEPYSKIIQKTFKQYGYTIAFKTNNKLSQKLKDEDNQQEDTGIYKLTCNECEKFYIGQTGRNFAKRFNEHIQEIRKPTSMIKSNYALHIKNNNHTFTDIDNNLSIIHKINKGDMMDRLEEIEIYKHRHSTNILNDRIKENPVYNYISVI